MAQAILLKGLCSLMAALSLLKGGRPRIDDRATLTWILFALKTGILCEYLPREFGCGVT